MKKNKKIKRISFSTAILCFVFSAFFAFNLFTPIENRLYDSRMSFTSRFFAPSEKIFLVVIDQESISWAQKELGWSWPWPRSAYAKITSYFSQSGAASLAFDMIYSEPSIYGADDDMQFADSARKYGHVVQTVFYEDSEYKKATRPIKPLQETAALIGDVTSNLDADRIARRGNLFSKSAEKEPSLSVASLLAAGMSMDFSKIPQAKDGGMYIRYHKDLDRFVPYSARQILQTQLFLEQHPDISKDLQNSPDSDLFATGDFSSDDFLPPEQFKDGFVFLGLYAPGLFDICAAPVSSTYPGVGVHLCMLDTILQKNYLHELPFACNIAAIILWTVLGFLTGSSIKKSGVKALVKTSLWVFLLCAMHILLNFLFFYKGIIIPLFAPLAALIFSYVTAIFEGYIIESAQKHYLKTAFRQYLSPKVIENLIENPELLHLGGEEKEITAYFSDVQGFTSISEKLSPVQLTELLNRYLSEMTDIILSFGGTIDKYEGDAIIAFWGAPTKQENHAVLALEAALACQKKLKEIQGDLQKITGQPFVQRIGINTGKAVVGNMGSRSRFDYTMMGDTVNLASRLEGINKQFGTYTICSKATRDSAMQNAGNLSFRKIADISVAGKKESVSIYVPMQRNDFSEIKKLQQIYLEGLENLKNADFAQAAKIFASIEDQDISAKKMKEKCLSLQKNPPENWDGILRFYSK